MNLTRRDLGKLALAAMPAARLLAKPNSKFGGVQVGLNAPYSYGDNNMAAAETLERTVKLGLSALELRTQPIEQYLGSPAATPAALALAKAPRNEQNQAALQALAEDLRKWRLARTEADFKKVRKYYNDAGVLIEIVKVDWIQNATDALVDYSFMLAKACGARAISCEIPQSKTKWLGAFADKHKFLVAYHGHTDISNPEAFAKPEAWEKAMALAKYNGVNLDIGHFVAANNTSPIPFIEKYHARISHLHIKDRKKNNGPNVPFGQGDTPVKEVLQLLKKTKWKIQATIEFEYPVPQGSDRMTEIAKCVEFCKNALA